MSSRNLRFRFTACRMAVCVLGSGLVGGLGKDACAQTSSGQSHEEVVPFAPQAVPVESAPPVLPETPFLAGNAKPVRKFEKWYGYQIMAADLTSVGLALFGSQTAFGEVGLVAAPSVIHGLHKRTRLAIASPILRVSLPLVGYFIATSSTSCTIMPGESECRHDPGLLGAGIGLVTAMILDWSLSWETVEASIEHGPPPRISLTSAGVAPTASGATVVLGGRF
jgi:hypothetical protein